ncbi:MAG TPA: MoaD/ThiS family protein [Xenococcaceae cyanobacterium]
MSDSSIEVTIKLFAAYQEAYKLSELQLNFPSDTTVGEVLNYLLTQKPQLAKWRDVTRFGVNLQFAEADTILNDGDEVVLIPPVSGG